jgi:hypothetical protein
MNSVVPKKSVPSSNLKRKRVKLVWPNSKRYLKWVLWASLVTSSLKTVVCHQCVSLTSHSILIDLISHCSPFALVLFFYTYIIKIKIWTRLSRLVYSQVKQGTVDYGYRRLKAGCNQCGGKSISALCQVHEPLHLTFWLQCSLFEAYLCNCYVSPVSSGWENQGTVKILKRRRCLKEWPFFCWTQVFLWKK